MGIIRNNKQHSFGMLMPGRDFSSELYRFGFNGKESDDEVKGGGNSLDFGARFYDSRIAKWHSMDPLFSRYVSLSPYHFSANSPIHLLDVDGRVIVIGNDVSTANRIKIEKAIEILRNINPIKIEEMETSEIVFEISVGTLNSIPRPEPNKPFTFGQTHVSYSNTSGLSVTPNKDEKGEIIPGKITRYKTEEEQNKWRNENVGKDILTENEHKTEINIDEVNKLIKVAGNYVQIELDPHTLETQRETAETIGHELLGHAYHDAIESLVDGWIWSIIGNESLEKGKGHDTNNPSGKAADDAGTKVRVNYNKAVKNLKSKNK